ncbi:MAG: hypothetical protein R2911_26025 [Caldilineaceae bacterium]
MMENGPVELVDRNNPIGVLVNVEYWNHMISELRRARLLVMAQHIFERNNRANSWIEYNELLMRLEEHHGSEIIDQIRQKLLKESNNG